MPAALETNESAYVALTLSIVARAKGVAEIANRRSFHANNFIARQALKAITPHHTMRTTLAVVDALGIKLSAEKVGDHNSDAGLNCW